MSAQTRIQRATNELTLFSTLEPTPEGNTVVTTIPTNIPSSPFTTSNINTNTTTTTSCSNQTGPFISTNANRSGKAATASEAMAGSRGTKRKLSTSRQDSISSDPDTTDKCECGADKPKTEKRAAVCPACKKAVCMFKGCKKRYNNIQNVNGHQPGDHTDAEIENFRKHRATHCGCGARRFKVPGQDYNKCPQCNRIWCTIEDCFASYARLADLIVHFESLSFQIDVQNAGIFLRYGIS